MVFPNNGSIRRRLASLHRVRSGRVPRIPRYYQGATTPAALPAALRFLRLAVPRERSVRFVSPAATKRQAAGLGLVTRYPRPGRLPWRRQDLPSSWGTPIPVCPYSRTPAGHDAPDHSRTSAWPPLTERRRLRRSTDFRGSIVWLSGSLSTYHARVTPLTAQDSLPGAGQALLDGLSTRRAPTKGFKLTSCSSSSSPKLAWHNLRLCVNICEPAKPIARSPGR